MVELLLHHEADPNRLDKVGLIPLSLAVSCKNLQMVQTLTAARLQTGTRGPQKPTEADTNLISPLSPISPLHNAVDLFWEEGIETLMMGWR